MIFDALHVVLAGLYVLAAILLVKPTALTKYVFPLASGAWAIHFVLVFQRGITSGQLPSVSRYEVFTLDSLLVAGLFLLLAHRHRSLRRAGALCLPLAALGLLLALGYSREIYPQGQTLQTPWMWIHTGFKSLTIGVATLAAAAALTSSDNALERRLLLWTFFCWSAVTAAGSYWASLAWGRYWGWDPIESWAFATVLAYGFAVHARFDGWWHGYKARLISLLPYAMLLFTLYVLVLVRQSLHSSYVFR